MIKNILLYPLILTSLVAFSALQGALIVEYDWESSLATDDKIGPVFTNVSVSTAGVPSSPSLTTNGIDGGNAMTFDGSNGSANAGGTSSEFKITSDFTVTTWVNLSSTSDQFDRMIDSTNSFGAISGATGWRLILNVLGGSTNYVTLQANGAGAGFINNEFSGLQQVQEGGWTFVALRYENSGNATVTVLQESQLGAGSTIVSANSSSVTSNGAMTYGSGAIPRLGVRSDAAGNQLNGSLDLVRLYDTALSDADLYTSFSTIPEPSVSGLVIALLGLATVVGSRRR